MASKNGSGYNRGYADYMNRYKAPLVVQARTGAYVWDNSAQAAEICKSVSAGDMHFFAQEYVRGWNSAEEQMAYANVG